MSSLERMLAILDLFTATVAMLTAEDIAARLDYSRPTAYRYVRVLVTAGLLVRMPQGYSLGPRIIELDWHIRRFDPVLAVSRPIIASLARSTGCDVTQMAMYGERIVTIDHEVGTEPRAIGFGRGRPVPLFRGAPSRAIIAFLPRARLKRLYERHLAELSPELRQRGFIGLYDLMQQVRRTGYAVSIGELEPENVGIAAPLRVGAMVSGSLCLVLTTVRYLTANQELLAAMVVDAARRIETALDAAGLSHASLASATGTPVFA